MSPSERAAADAYCAQLATQHYENFVVASKFVSKSLRGALMRFYAFCRTTDDFGDESGSPEAALDRLARWRAETESFFAGEQPIHPVFVALRETVDAYALPAKPFLDLIAANEQDQRVFAYENWPELEAYCQLSAAPVGRVVLRLFGVRDPRAEQLSDDVCTGLQLANHAQDVSRDELLGRRYLLASDVRERGVPGAVQALVERARTLLDSGRRLEPMVPGVLRLQLALYRLGGLAICDEIAALRYRTDVRRPSVSKARKMALLLRAVAEALKPQQPGVEHAETA